MGRRGKKGRRSEEVSSGERSEKGTVLMGDRGVMGVY
jgi:hypothetical protein